MRIDRELIRRIKYLTGITLGVYLILRYLLPLVIPFLMAVVLAIIIHPVAVFIYRKIKIPYKIASVILVFLVGTAFVVSVGAIVYYGFLQIKDLMSNYPFMREKIIGDTKQFCSVCDEWFGMKGGQMYATLVNVTEYINDNYTEKIMPVVTERAWNICILCGKGMIVFLFFIIGTILVMEQYRDIVNDCKRSFLVKRFVPMLRCLKDTICAYIKTEAIIIVIVSTVCTFGLILIKNPYALLIGILIALIDALPVIGSGSILVPWSIISLLSGKYVNAAVLITLYLICLITREVLEAKLMGQQTGLRPIYTFISFFVGIKLFGVAGILLGPVAMVMIRFIYLSALKYRHK